MSIGEKIREKRRTAKCSQCELAKKIGVAQPTVCNYERDLRAPRMQTIKKIAKVLDTSVDYLVNDK